MKAAVDTIYGWVDERLGLTEAIAFAKHKVVPDHRHSFWYYWGGISLFFFLVQAITGVLLLIYYRPGPEAYESVRQITFEVHFGWLIRSAHSWAANLMIASIFIHMFSVYFLKAYRSPREFGWWSGLALLLVGMVFGFSGYLLPMNQLAYYATKVGLQIAGSLPMIGPKLADLVRGGPEVGDLTVQRFFALHVVVLPALCVPLLSFHLWLVQRHGNAWPPSVEAAPGEARRTIAFFPNFLMKDLAMWLIGLNVLALLASLFPWELGQPADPLSTPEGIHPEWYFMSSFQVLKVFGQLLPGAVGEGAGMVLFTLGLALWFLVPLFDTSRRAGQRARQATCFGLLTLAVLLVTTIWAYWAIR